MSARSATELDGRDKPRRTVTTGYAAKAFNVAPRTISKWFDAGVLEGYRVPISGDRRIYLDSVRKLAYKFGIMPKKRTVEVLVAAAPGMRETLTHALAQRTSDDQQVEVIAKTTREETLIAAIRAPDISIIDLDWLGRTDGVELCKALNCSGEHFGFFIAGCDEADPESLEDYARAVFPAGGQTPEEIAEKVWQTLFPLDEIVSPPRPCLSAAAQYA